MEEAEKPFPQAQQPQGKKRYIVEFDREGCIGANACVVVFPKYWKVAPNGKVDLEGSEEVEKEALYRIEIGEDELEKMKESAFVCPVNVIHIFEKDTNEKIV